ncbi:Homeobox-like_domain superfamily [Hexamita inflata]|uniref:Homeobox-like_domain superfamily n=1 Tax=Hexamita inflata TaxID=28002 RepID=A0ABP1GVE2_9EUKA
MPKRPVHVWTENELQILKRATLELNRKWKQIQQIYFKSVPLQTVRNKGYTLEALDIQTHQMEQIINQMNRIE